MRKTAVALSVSLIAGTLLLSACSDKETSNAPASGSAAAPSESSSESPAAVTGPEGTITASDMSKLPDAAKQRTDTIIVALTDPSGAFTPYFHQSGYDGNVSSLLFTPLVTVDDKGVPTPALAESWDVSPDNLTYTFHLRKDAKFSDGSPITADDVAFTWTLLHDKAYDGDSTVPSVGVKGGQEYKEGKASSISGIKVIDPLTVSVTLDKPNATALLTLGSDVLSKAYYGKDYKFGQLDYIKDLNAKPVGTGPYKLEKFIPGQEVRMVANENYYLGKPKTEHFIYKTSQGDPWQFLETGEIDYSTFVATQENVDKLKSLGYLNILPYIPSNYGYIQMNLEHDALKDKRVRQAIAYGLDRQSIYVDANQGAGQVANIPAPPISWSYTEDGINPYKFDLEKAKQLLDEAGWKPGSDGIREKDGKKLTFHYLASTASNKKHDTDVFLAVATENFKELGVNFEPELFPDFNALVSKVESGDYDLASFSTPLLLDPSDGLLQFVDGEIKGYDNPKVKELYDEALATNDIEQRKTIYKELYQILNDELPVIFTSYKKQVSAYNGRIDGLTVSPINGITPTLQNWSLK